MDHPNIAKCQTDVLLTNFLVDDLKSLFRKRFGFFDVSAIRASHA